MHIRVVLTEEVLGGKRRHTQLVLAMVGVHRKYAVDCNGKQGARGRVTRVCRWQDSPCPGSDVRYCVAHVGHDAQMWGGACGSFTGKGRTKTTARERWGASQNDDGDHGAGGGVGARDEQRLGAAGAGGGGDEADGAGVPRHGGHPRRPVPNGVSW